MNMRTMRVVGALLVSAAWSCGVSAQDAGTDESRNAVQDLAGRFYVSPMYSHTFASGRRHTDDADGGMLAIGKQVSPRALLELYGSYNQYGGKDDGAKDANLETAGLAAAMFPWATGQGILGGAYGLIGVSWADGSKFPLRNEKYDQNRSGYAFDIGAGYLARLPFLSFASLRFDVRYRMNFVREAFASVDPRDESNDHPNINDVVASVGLLVPFGARPASAPPPAPAPITVVPPAAQ
jgi:hypothetical protein